VKQSKADDMPCTAYNQDPSSCPANKCELIDGVCWEAGKELPCESLCSASTCIATGRCLYNDQNNGMGKCTACESSGCPAEKECSTYKTEETCPESHCTFNYFDHADDSADDHDDHADDDKGDPNSFDYGECVAHQCVSMWDVAECQGAGGQKLGCKWDPADASCWPAAFSKPCDQFYDGTACNNNAGCDWNAEKYECGEKGATPFCENQYTDKECNALSNCQWNSEQYSCSEKSSNFPSTPPPLNGPGDGTGNEDMTKCTSSLYSAVKPKLEAAEVECIVHGRRARAADGRVARGSGTDQQLECLAYFLGQSPNPTTISDACPCLWAWATEIKPWEDHWMKIKC
jgi:hypothetical protein